MDGSSQWAEPLIINWHGQPNKTRCHQQTIKGSPKSDSFTTNHALEAVGEKKEENKIKKSRSKPEKLDQFQKSALDAVHFSASWSPSIPELLNKLWEHTGEQKNTMYHHVMMCPCRMVEFASPRILLLCIFTMYYPGEFKQKTKHTPD